ncbi:AIPR family protein [Acetobacter tropicalis]|uniref:AIPR family protein n=1 Tax=Acetobacter tropicalis TaxID=104102 RepID=UPI003975AFB4
MHRIVKSHLDDFKEQYSITGTEDRIFESFLNFSIFRKFCLNNIDPNVLRYDGEDPGIDGVMIFIGDEYVSSPEEVQEAFSGRKREMEVFVIFTQAKTSEKWDKSEITNFQSAILDFLSESSLYPHSEYMKNQKCIFEEVLKNVGKIKGGKPIADCYFSTTAPPATTKEILAARDAMRKSISDTGLFSNVDVILLNRDSLIPLWKSTSGGTETTLPILGSAAFIKAPNISEAYVITCRANDFINNVLKDETGKLRQSVFDQNVRDFLGSDAEINSEISSTLDDKSKQVRFGILNNGITLISPDIRMSGLELFIKDFQIVNGCQTSNVLFEHSHSIDDDTTLMLKVVETSDQNVVDDIVKSTNRQAKVNEDQFLSTINTTKKIEQYFNIRGKDADHRLYFERRTNQYASHENVKAVRLFDIRELARCFSSMFLDKPEIASRYPNKLTKDSVDIVFNPSYNEEVYYVSAFSLYRIKMLISNGRVEAKFGKLRWHIIMAIKYYLLGEQKIHLNSRKIEEQCAKIEKFISSNEEDVVSIISRLCSEIVEIDNINSDNLKSTTLVQTIKQNTLKFRKENPPPKNNSLGTINI